MNRRRLVFAGLLPGLPLGLLAACATPPSGRADDPLVPWIQGRLLVRVAATPERASISESLAFELRGTGDEGELRLNSPLGPRLATASWAPGLALLQRADATVPQRFSSLEELSQQLLGEALPLAALPDWLQGRAWPQAPQRSLAGEEAAGGGFEQMGWRVLLARRAQGWIEARREAAPSVLLRVKLDNPP